MSSFGDNGLNRVFRNGIAPAAPYYYIQASLDLSGRSAGTYYFNYDNNYAYATAPDYKNFVLVDDNVILSEVLVYSSPDLVATGPSVLLTVGGAASTSTPVVVPWAAPAGEAPVAPPDFVGGPLTVSQVNAGAVNYFGHEGGHFPYFLNRATPPVEDLSTGYRYLALTVTTGIQEVLGEPESADDRSRRAAARAARRRPRLLPSGPVVIESGSINVVIKVYPKEQ